MYIVSRLNIYKSSTTNITMNEDYEEEELSEEQESGIYDEDFVDELRENDEIDDFEEAFMRGYNEDEEE